MRRSRRFWAAVSVLAIGCGGRTMLDGLGVLGGDGGDGTDGPIDIGDGPISRLDGPITRGDGPVIVDDGGFGVDVVFPDVTVPCDVFVPPPPPPPPPFEGGEPPGDAIVFPFDGPVTIEDGGFPEDGFPGFDAGTEGGAPVFCGGEFCFSGEQCCVGFGGGGVSASCVPSGDCDAGLSLTCTGSDNCTGGEVCCASFEGMSGSASCEPSCGPGNVQLCTVDGICPPGDTCVTTPFGLAFCRP
jgi:hypothetical protein